MKIPQELSIREAIREIMASVTAKEIAEILDISKRHAIRKKKGASLSLEEVEDLLYNKKKRLMITMTR